MRAIALTMTMLLLAGCSTDPHLMNTSNGGDGPDEFGIVPTKPLQMPDDLNVLPSPTPGGGNLTDPTPLGDAVAALDEGLALPGHVEMQREVVGALVPPDVQDVAEAFRRDHPAFGAIVLDRDVGRGRRAVDDGFHLGRGDPGHAADALRYAVTGFRPQQEVAPGARRARTNYDFFGGN